MSITLELTEKYNLERINYLKQNKSKITEEILDELRSFGLAGKQIALDILDVTLLDKFTTNGIQDIHCIEIQKCREDLFYFKDNYLLILNKDELQDKMLKAILTNKKVQLTSSRQTKKSYVAVIYALHQFNFEVKKTIGIAGDKYETAKYRISDITNLYNQIPLWMRIPARNLKTSMVSEAAVQIIIDKADEKAFIGRTLNTLIVDNSATAKSNKLEEFFNSVIPSMSAIKDSKIIVIEKNQAISPEFYEINENTILEVPVKVEKPILRRTFKQIIKDIIESLYNKIKG